MSSGKNNKKPARKLSIKYRLIQKLQQQPKSMGTASSGQRGFEAGMRAGANPNMDDFNKHPFNKPSKKNETSQKPTTASPRIGVTQKSSCSTSKTSQTTSSSSKKGTSNPKQDKFLEAMELTSGPEDGYARKYSK